MDAGISGKALANRSISISLDGQLLAQLDAQGANRSALVSEALQQWLARRRLEVLDRAYADLARLEAGDLAAAGDDAITMGVEALCLPLGSQSWQWPRGHVVCDGVAAHHRSG